MTDKLQLVRSVPAHLKTIDLDCHKNKNYYIINMKTKTIIDSGSCVDSMLSRMSTLNLVEAGCVIVNMFTARKLLPTALK